MRSIEQHRSPTSGNPSLAQPMIGLQGRQLSRARAGVVCHPVKNTWKAHGKYRSCIYSVATGIQREREALTNMAAG